MIILFSTSFNLSRNKKVRFPLFKRVFVKRSPVTNKHTNRHWNLIIRCILCNLILLYLFNVNSICIILFFGMKWPKIEICIVKYTTWLVLSNHNSNFNFKDCIFITRTLCRLAWMWVHTQSRQMSSFNHINLNDSIFWMLKQSDTE